MAKITEKEIVNHLREKVRFHQNEAKRIEDILSAFSLDSLTSNAKKTTSAKTSEAFEKFAQKKKRGRKPNALKLKTEKPPKALEVPASYNDNLTINGKIAFALSQIGSGFNEDIATEIAKYEPKSDAKKIGKQISGILSTLKSKGQLNAEKSGRKDRFSLA